MCLEKQQLLRTLAQEDEVVKRQLLMPAAVVEKRHSIFLSCRDIILNPR